MLYYLHLWTEWFSPLRVFRYITVRSFGAAGTAFLLTLLLGPWVIRRLKQRGVGQVERAQEIAPLHAVRGPKAGTPTMGGILIVAANGLATLLWAAPGNLFVLLTLATLCFMGVVGFWDDYRKHLWRDSRGLPARAKAGLQVLWAAAVFGALRAWPQTHDLTTCLMVPFLKDPVVRDMGEAFAFLFLVLVMVGASNAVNLTDGVDGLAIGCTGSAAVCYLVMAYVAGHVHFATYLNVPHVPGSGELAVFCGALLGASLGFLWFNCHPAQIFMGDTGSLALGGAMAMVVILIKQELTLVIVGGVFVMEAASVILQVGSLRLRGKRLFRMSPIHHHFQLRQWSETQVTVRFWILSIICALFGVLTLKIR